MGKSNSIRNIIIAIIMAIVSLWIAATDVMFGWAAAVFFGSMTIILLIKHFKSSHRSKAKTNSPEFNSQLQSQLEEPAKSILDFGSGNFTIQIEQDERQVAWKQVQSMIAYKMDRFASDDICLDVFCDNNINFTITEESAAWDKFLDHSKKALPVIDKFWEIEIVAAAFENNPTLVYDRQNRTLKDIVKKYYKE